MKNRLRFWVFFVLVWLFIYLITITVGLLIVVPSTYASHEHQKTVANNDAEEYWQTGQFSQTSILFQASAFVCDADGRLLDSSIAEGNNMDFSVRARELIPTIVTELDGVYQLVYDTNLDGRLAMIIAVPSFIEGRLDTVYFFVKSLTSLYSNLRILFIAITFMLLLSAIYSGLTIKKDRDLEKLRRDYVANVSHDLKSPISSIMSLAEVMSEGIVTNNEKLRKYSGIILKESQALEKTVLGMLDLSQMQSGRRDFSKIAVQADTLLCPIIETYGAICHELGISLHVQEGISYLPKLYTNISCASELLDILLDNAVKFVRNGGNIWLEWTSASKHITISVRDNGTGISRENRRRIFERFFKGDGEGAGSGLGLAIAREIADGLGEKLWVESEPGKGAAFHFTIRLR